MQFSSRRTNSPGKEWHYSSVGRKNSPGAIFPSDGRIDSTLIIFLKYIHLYLKYILKHRFAKDQQIKMINLIPPFTRTFLPNFELTVDWGEEVDDLFAVFSLLPNNLMFWNKKDQKKNTRLTTRNRSSPKENLSSNPKFQLFPPNVPPK